MSGYKTRMCYTPLSLSLPLPSLAGIFESAQKSADARLVVGSVVKYVVMQSVVTLTTTKFCSIKLSITLQHNISTNIEPKQSITILTCDARLPVQLASAVVHDAVGAADPVPLPILLSAALPLADAVGDAAAEDATLAAAATTDGAADGQRVDRGHNGGLEVPFRAGGCLY